MSSVSLVEISLSFLVGLVDKSTGEQEIKNISSINIIMSSGGLTIVATPIGNLDDISKRAVDALIISDFVICENPKHSLKLLNKLGIKKKLISIHDHNEIKVIKKIENDLNNKKFVLISDAGSPLISDPGHKLIRHCINKKISLTCIPGPTSVIAALQLSGLSLNNFTYLGFLPKTKKKIIDFIKNIENSRTTSVFFVSTHKLEMCLECIENFMSQRSLSVCKELTKVNEFVFRGTAKQIKEELYKNDKNMKGEFVFVVEGNDLKTDKSIDLGNLNNVIKKLLGKFSLTEVVEIVHKLSNIKRNIIYKWLLNLKNT